MEAWVCILHLTLNRAVTVDVQNEDAMVMAMKAITKVEQIEATCINQFDGRVFYFKRGMQVDVG